mgnify:CR=1 FL=1
MKIIIKKTAINEEKDKNKQPVKFASGEPKHFSRYELDDMDTDHQMVELLRQCLEQLKVLNHHSTPAKGIGASGIEKYVAQHRVAEQILYHLKEIQKDNTTI